MEAGIIILVFACLVVIFICGLAKSANEKDQSAKPYVESNDVKVDPASSETVPRLSVWELFASTSTRVTELNAQFLSIVPDPNFDHSRYFEMDQVKIIWEQVDRKIVFLSDIESVTLDRSRMYEFPSPPSYYGCYWDDANYNRYAKMVEDIDSNVRRPHYMITIKTYSGESHHTYFDGDAAAHATIVVDRIVAAVTEAKKLATLP